MTTITSPRQLPDQPLRMFQVSSQTEAEQIAGQSPAWYYSVKKIHYVFVQKGTP